MNAPASSSRKLQTGLFEIDLSSGQVHKSGRRVPLQEQPFRVLAMLLERPGDVVTRQELQTRIWPADTYVGFDEGLNTAIRKLRTVFEDTAGNPRFIETLPRRGYRFIAPVSELTAADRAPAQTALLEIQSGRGDDGFAGPALAGQTIEAHTASGAVIDTARPRSLGRYLGAVAALLFALAVLAYVVHTRRTPKTSGSARAMLVVLPFENLSNDPGQEYFSDGLTEETITDLGQLSPEHLGVIARTSAMAYKHTGKTVSQIGRELAVDYVLEGSVRREGERARVSAQLIRVSDQTHLWAESYDRELKDLLDVQNDLARAIAEQVQANLTPEQQLELSKKHTVNPEAYDLYLKGRFYWNERTPGAVQESIAYFQQATATDPNFALAYAGVADAYNFSNIIGLYSPRESFPQARTAAMRAIELDPSLAEAHAALGMEKSHYEFDFPGAEKEFLKAIEVNPNSAYAHLFYANCFLLPMGRTEQAIAENKRAVELDPLSLPINNFMAMTYMFAGDYEHATQQFQHTIAMNPSFPLAHEYFSWLLATVGKDEESIKENEKSEVLGGASPEEAAAEATVMLRAFKTGGAKNFRQKQLELDLQLREKSVPYLPASLLAHAYSVAGDNDKAFLWLDKAYDQREGQDLTLLKVDPDFQNLHHDPRFASLLQKLGLPQ
jgi:TolB-like protein/DNA-binding winged helix-turn-helix (wHTH) protein/Tfp pilus assembly protein PilF